MDNDSSPEELLHVFYIPNAWLKISDFLFNMQLYSFIYSFIYCSFIYLFIYFIIIIIIIIIIIFIFILFLFLFYFILFIYLFIYLFFFWGGGIKKHNSHCRCVSQASRTLNIHVIIWNCTSPMPHIPVWVKR